MLLVLQQSHELVLRLILCMNFLACSAIIREIIRTGVASLSFASLTQSRKMKEPPCINQKENVGQHHY